MDRRNFLQLAALALAGKAAQRVFPFRVYSIPKKIVVAPGGAFTVETLRVAQKQIMERLGVKPLEGLHVNGIPLAVYSPDFKVNRGSFLAAMDGDNVVGDIPRGVEVGDVLVSDSHGPLSRVGDIVAHASLPYLGVSGKRTGVYLNLARS